MANTDKVKWLLYASDLTTRVGGDIPALQSHLYLEMSEPGSGEIRVPLDSTIAGLVSAGQFVQCEYRGAVRGGFFVEFIKPVDVDQSENAGRVLSISGRGALAILSKEIVLHDGTNSTTRTFTNVTKASILKTLIDEAQAVGGLSTLTYDFTAANDSASIAWTDNENYEIPVGTTLLNVARQFCKTGGFDFDINLVGGNFVLSAYSAGIGTDVSSTIHFRVGSNCEEVSRDTRAGEELKNTYLVKYKGGFISVSDSTSIAANERHAGFINIEQAQTAASATTYAAAKLAINKDPKESKSVKVWDGVAPNVFLDYGMGYTVRLDRFGSETDDRILGIQLVFDGDTFASVVMDFNYILYDNNIRLEQELDWLLNQWNTARDADLLEVSFWAAIGNDDFAFLPGEMSPIGRYLCMHKIGDTIYFANTNNGRLTSYSIASGQWELASELTLSYPHCITSIGTDLYIGGGGAWKFDTLTGTLTLIGVVYPTGSPIGRIFSAAVIGTDVYFGGKFDNVDSTTYGNFVRYDTVAETWHDCGSGATGTVNTLLADGSNVVLGGDNLSAINGVAVNKVGKWNGTTGVAMSTGLDNAVYALAVYGSNILAGGTFTGGISEWNGSSWTTLGGGVVGSVYGIAVYLTDIYIIGTFTDVGNYIARYSGGAWWQLLNGLNDYASDIVLNNDDVYVTGIFTSADGKAAQYVAAYFTNFESLVDYLENASSSFNMAAAIHAAPASAISDSDEMGFWEDVSNALRKITWANIKATLKTYFDTIYATVAGSDTQVQYNNGGAFGGNEEFIYDDMGQIISLGKTGGGEASHVFSWQAGGVAFHNIATWGADLYSSVRGILARGTKGTPIATLADDVVMRFRGSGYDGVGPVLLSATDAEMRVVNNEDHSATNHGTRLEFWVTPDGSIIEIKALTIGADGSLKNGAASDYENTANKNAPSGYPGLDGLYKLILHDTMGANASKLTHSNTAARTYIFPDKSMTVAGTNEKLDDFATPDDNTDLNANTTNHGLLMKLTAPAAGALNVLGIASGETEQAMKALFDTTNPAAIGTAAPGTQIIASRRDHVHNLDNGQSVLAGTFDITAAVGTFEDTGLAVTLPSAGTYKITANVRGVLTGNAGSDWYMVLKLYNSTDAADVANSERILLHVSVTATALRGTSPMDIIITVAASKIIKLYAKSDGTGPPTFTTRSIRSDANGRTLMMYEKIG